MTAAFHDYFMRLALREADQAAAANEVPTGCVIIDRPVDDTIRPVAVKVLGRAHNQTEMLHDPTAHAEMIAITQAAAARGDFRLTDTVLYVTKEPCPMCAGAIVLARIPTVVYGVADPQRGGQSVFQILTHPQLIHRAEVIGDVLGDVCRERLQAFFRNRRDASREQT
ncbi:MAG: nucleoside deaminase [Lentisphaerae bacterium]|nr:nucleoside deaminase [Lentisphaerota bacterium]